jgi:hypothetical protein
MPDIKYEELLDVADTAQYWYDGQRDPVYALVSSVFAGHDVPLNIAEDALYNLEKDYKTARGNKLFKPEDVEKLGEACSELEFKINETRSYAAKMPNPRRPPEQPAFVPTDPKRFTVGQLLVLEELSGNNIRHSRRYTSPIAVNARRSLEGSGYIRRIHEPPSDWNGWEITYAGKEALIAYRNSRRAIHGLGPAKENPMGMGSSEKVAIGVGAVAGVAALIYYLTRPAAVATT